MKQEKKLLKLYIELVKLQKEIIASQLKLLVILEGRDAAGKDGTIKAITLHLSPRETKVVALSKPSDRECREWYYQRYTSHLPASGEFVLFNRSWYNRAGVEKVMGFCTDKEYISFFTEVELFEKMLTDAGVIIFKYYLDISKKEQRKRMEDRKENPLKQWKVSPIDEVALKRWHAYSKARDRMLLQTNFRHSPWYVVNADDKEAAHIALISHLLKQLSYTGKNKKLLSEDDDLVYAATADAVQQRLFR
ncbi:polyphosphate kinase 2 [Chitinophaga sp. Cy-1792]|uniref:polyphosphate kinase 2 n=1 Tax=Chitinophaga sp. Cy-1792 TaxID=2608339 RepID=UPI00141DF4E4|nr:polyphosphate kinase 2 [Chitinophaga sp. Cy-1792]NIG55977.1 polyphosphate kinase 2 [Chitinophaga sp. Cy-1792]